MVRHFNINFYSFDYKFIQVVSVKVYNVKFKRCIFRIRKFYEYTMKINCNLLITIQNGNS